MNDDFMDQLRSDARDGIDKCRANGVDPLAEAVHILLRSALEHSSELEVLALEHDAISDIADGIGVLTIVTLVLAEDQQSKAVH